MMTLADYLKQNNLTQRSFAAQVGVSPSYMNEIVQRVKWPAIKVAAKIERLTNGEVSMASLVPPEPAPALSPDNEDAA